MRAHLSLQRRVDADGDATVRLADEAPACRRSRDHARGLPAPGGADRLLVPGRAPRRAAASRTVDVERLRLPARAVEGKHQLTAKALAEWVPADQALQLGNELRLAGELEIGIDPALERDEMFLVDASSLRAPDRPFELRECGPAPQHERLTKAFGRNVGNLPARLVDQSFEPCEVELAIENAESVSGRCVPIASRPSVFRRCETWPWTM